jgi:hypothetical protein
MATDERTDPLARRRFERSEPAHVVQVTAESEGASRSLGEVLNLSAGGACLALHARDLAVGDEVILWLRFARPRQPVPATGRVVWTSGGWGRPRYGVEWTHVGPQRSWIGWATKA